MGALVSSKPVMRRSYGRRTPIRARNKCNGLYTGKSNMAAQGPLLPAIIGYGLFQLFEDDEEEKLQLYLLQTELESARKERVKTQGYFEVTIPRYLPDTFQRFFRVSRNTFEILCQQLGACPEMRTRLYRGGREELHSIKKVLLVLRYLASQETILEISDKFNVTEYTLLKYRRQVLEAVYNNMMGRIITWPTQNELPDVAQRFNDMGQYQFPGVIGAIDGTHIPIEAPRENPQAYFNRKKFHSVILQAVCKDNLEIIDINVGWPGRVHDAKVLRNSTVWEDGDRISGYGRFHLIGDGAYPLKRWLLTPFRDNGHLTAEQKKFNKSLSSKRQVIERSFGLLKGRFRRLKHINMIDIKEICNVVCTAVVFHNICISNGENLEEFMEEDDDLMPPINPLFDQQERNAEGALKRFNMANRLRFL
ncbi:unnamed protein product [Mytilus edulis]|uniref:DDE Tnp4 domain-containing protein n=1 Tax=Mytilus edulis TaxID=6550 RepID=A0A8S3SSZ3_MYTED|nr:unnamed protein product [Mytilus edulis]